MEKNADHNKKNEKETSYPNLPSALRPAPHGDSLHVPLPKNLTNVSIWQQRRPVEKTMT